MCVGLRERDEIAAAAEQAGAISARTWSCSVR
jgi:hypothetical protein